MYGGHPNQSLNGGEFRCLGNFGNVFGVPKKWPQIGDFQVWYDLGKPFLCWYGILGVKQILPIQKRIVRCLFLMSCFPRFDEFFLGWYVFILEEPK